MEINVAQFTSIIDVNKFKIFFLGQGKCGVAVVRISGPQCHQVMSAITGFKVCPPPRTAVLRKLSHPESGKIIDRGLVLYFSSNVDFLQIIKKEEGFLKFKIFRTK